MGMTGAAEAKMDVGAVKLVTGAASLGNDAAGRGRGSGRPESSAGPLSVALPDGVVYLRRGRGASGPVAGGPAAATRRTPVRLTRRGRIVVGTLVGITAAAAASVIWLAVAGQAQASSHAGAAVPLRSSMVRVVVRPGQTLWEIAEKADPSADPRTIVPQIVTINSLPGTGIDVGQVLWVPRD
ncbi:MAG TPA: LysM peptidoglycan-binding domain-containing protein [Streptosporangiaceae bacterium]|jgi:hypothetical protein|nr:LysM peptidoglycan-binding domain-containing protein [Streptosporangiaceae bacterium]